MYYTICFLPQDTVFMIHVDFDIHFQGKSINIIFSCPDRGNPENLEDQPTDQDVDQDDVEETD